MTTCDNKCPPALIPFPIKQQWPRTADAALCRKHKVCVCVGALVDPHVSLLPVQAQLVPVMWELVGSKHAGSRIAAALLAGAAAPSLYKQQVTDASCCCLPKHLPFDSIHQRWPASSLVASPVVPELCCDVAAQDVRKS